MEDEVIQQIVAELGVLIGRVPGKLFQLGPLTLAIDFRVQNGYLLISAEPTLPRLHLIKRRVRDLEKRSTPLTQFAQGFRNELAQLVLASIEKDPNDRIVRFKFAGDAEPNTRELVVQLTGRAANLFVLDENGVILHRARAADDAGQQIGDRYQGPSSRNIRAKLNAAGELLAADQGRRFKSISEAADAFYTSLLSARAFDAKVATAAAALRKKISRQQKLLKELQKDLTSQRDALEQKRIGDLLLANASSAIRKGEQVTVIDYFDADQSAIEIEVDERLTLAQEAARRFKLYSRAKRGLAQTNSRLGVTEAELKKLQAQLADLEKSAADRDEAALAKFSGDKPAATVKKKSREEKIPGTRSYLSSDGFRVIVGRGARDNDNLTFKVARPNDLWLHAADYPGSHVIVRNSTRKEIPHRTIIEAAQLAAHFSQASKDPKVDVRYTQRKFISKPKGAAPGLVRMSRFKNITVGPKEDLERI
jgi:predicted ribosome quality control (RQC) complex YloA/Tae2 family protein